MTATPAKPDPATADPYRWVILFTATLTQAGTAFVFLGVGALAGFIQESFNLTGAQTGLLVAAVGSVPLVALIPIGRALDHGRERWIIAGGALVLAGGAALASLSESYPLILAMLLLGGAGYSSSQPGGSKVVAGWFPDYQRGLGMGIRQTGLPLGGALAAAVLPVVATASGWESALLVGAVVAGVGGVLFAVTYRPMPFSTRTAPIGFGAEVRGLIRVRAIRLAMMAGLGMVAIQFVLISYLMLYLRDVHGIPLARGSWMLFATQGAGVLGRVALAIWSDRLHDRLRPVAVSAAAAAIGTVLLATIQPGAPYALLLALSAVMGFFAFGWYGPWVVYVAEAAPGRAIGTTLALAMTANQVAIVLAPPLFGLIYDLTSSYTVPLIATAVMLAGVAGRTWHGSRRLPPGAFGGPRYP
ncbi:MAG: MFS transporter [Acidimicrobiia bacterium]|nr:MFS transporter [Acidimicrobiia bacterium]